MNMKKSCLLRFCLFLGVVSILATSCRKADIDFNNISEEIYLPGELKFPVGKTQITLLDLLEQTPDLDNVDLDTVKTDIVIFMSDSVVLTYRQDDIDLKDINITLDPDLTNSTGLLGTDKKSFKIEASDDIAVKRISVREMSVEMIVTTNIDKEKLKIVTSFPTSSIKGTDGEIVSNTCNLRDGYSQNLTFSNFLIELGVSNEIVIQADVYAIDGESVSPDDVKIYYEIKDVAYETIWGKIPPNILQKKEQTHEFDISILDGFSFLSPKLEVNATSNVGAKFNIVVDSLEAYCEENSVRTQGVQAIFKDKQGNETPSFAVESEDGPKNPGEVAKILENFELSNKNVTNIASLFTTDPVSDKMPNRLHYRFSIDGIESEVYEDNFMTSDPQIKISAKATIPFHVAIHKAFVYKDTLDVSGSEDLPKDITLEELAVKLKVGNGLPAEFSLSLTDFLDVDGNHVDGFYDANDNLISILGENPKTISAPTTNADGMVTGEKKMTDITISIDKRKYDGLRTLRSIVYEIAIDKASIENPNAHFTINDAISIHAGILLKAEGLKVSDFDTDKEGEE